VGQGEQRHYHDNGQLEMVVELSNGEEYGDLVRLDREGRVISRTTYQKGRVVQRTH
jgi:antitoxin component YwqK of YwqJK toxin-antitoxin module